MANCFTVQSAGASLRGEMNGHGTCVIMLHAGVADRRMWYDTLAYLGRSDLEHVPAKCTHFADKNMLQHIDPGALSYRRNGSISTESALVLPRESLVKNRRETDGPQIDSAAQH
jgi:hypothetical protein